MSANTEALPAAAVPAAGTTNPWLIAVVVALAVFMEVLDTTIANVALPYIAGGLGVSQDEASWVVTTYLVANAIIITATSFLPQRFGRKSLFPFLSRVIHAELHPVRHGLESAIASPVPCPAGVRRRRHGAGGAIDSCGLLPAPKTRSGFRALRGCGGRRARRWPDAWRLDRRQLQLAMELPHQRPGRARGHGACLCAGEGGSAGQQGLPLRFGRLPAGRHLPRISRSRLGPGPRGRLVRIELHHNLLDHLRARLCGADPMGSGAEKPDRRRPYGRPRASSDPPLW